MSTNLIADWTGKGRKFLVGDIARETPLWLPTAMFISRCQEYEGRDSSVSAWQSRLRDVVDRLSPLGEEQTCWGFVRQPNSREHLLYMTSQKTVQQATGSRNGEAQVRFWYPGVLALLDRSAKTAKSAEWRFLLERQCVTAARFEAGKIVPAQVISRFYEGGGIRKDWREIYAELRAEAAKHEDCEIRPLQQLKASEIRINATRLDLEWEQWDEDTREWRDAADTQIKSEVLTTGNLRPLSTNEQRQIKEARFNQMGWWMFLGLVAVLIVQGLLYAGILWKTNRNHRMTAEIESQKSKVQQIVAAHSELAFLRGLERERGNPFDWMLVLNANRPERVVLENFIMRDGRLLTVRGTARQPGEVSTFRESLEKTGEFSKIELTTGRSDQAGTEFTLNLQGARYKPLWKPPVPEAQEGEQAPEGQNAAPVEGAAPESAERKNNQENETSSVNDGSQKEVSA